jgi:putative radical SAM enzyme (TIGR03279 family)
VNGGRLGSVPGGVIAAVEPGSLGEEIGLEPGDRLVSINGHPLRDIIDVQFYGAEESLDLKVERDGERWRIEVERDYEEELGLAFVNSTFDVDIRRCANNCDFCFVKQNAPGMRRSLYIKDDDYRYSFLFGNFVTLTNLTGDDWARLEEQRLSPLYVSVHATDLELRRRFLARKNAPDIMDQLRRLADLGIEVHTQVVLVPGLNDGEHFVQTIDDLMTLFEKPVASVGVVPVGLTRYHRGQCRPHTPEESRIVLAQLRAWMADNRRRLGSSWVYPSDEWYLVARREVPPADEYDGSPQIENGVGMVRQLLDEWQALKEEMLRTSKVPRISQVGRTGEVQPTGTLVCGTLISPVMERILEEMFALTGADVQLVPVVNEFFGPVTTVSGLLTGQDVIATLRGRPLGDVVLLPRAMFTGSYGAGSTPPGMTLDDMMIDDIAARLSVRVEMAGTMAEVLAALE